MYTILLLLMAYQEAHAYMSGMMGPQPGMMGPQPGMMGMGMMGGGAECMSMRPEDLLMMIQQGPSAEPIIMQCLPSLLSQYPQRAGQRLCALAQQAMQMGIPSTVQAILGNGNCLMFMDSRGARALHNEAQRMGPPMLDIVMQNCPPGGQYMGGLGGLGHGLANAAGSLIGGVIGGIAGAGGALHDSVRYGGRGGRYGMYGGMGMGMRGGSFLGSRRYQLMPGEVPPPDFLATLHTSDARMIGMNGECAMLSPIHFTHPGVRPNVIRALPEVCFQSLPLECFAAMDEKTARALKYWPMARPDQISALPPDSLAAIDFDRLGPGPQHPMAPDPMHPCSGVTPQQEYVLKQSFWAWHKYSKRCLGDMHSAGMWSGMGTWIGLGAVVFLLFALFAFLIE